MAGNVHQSTESSIPAAEDHHYVASSSSTPSSSWTVVASTVGRAAVGRFWRTCINRHGSGSGPVSINGNNNYWLPVVRMTSASGGGGGGGLMTGDGDYWIFVLKLFYGPELEDTWECVFSVPRVTLAFAARATGVFFLLGLGGYLSLKVFRWISASKNSLESPRQCRSPISCSSWGSTAGDRLPSGPLDLESVFLHQHHSYQPLLNPRVLPERNTSGRRCHVSPRKTNAKRKDRARQLAAQSSSAKTSPRHMRKFGFGDPCVPAAAFANYYPGCSSSDAQQELSFFAMGAVARGKKSMCHQGSAAWDTDSYAADLSDTNHGKTSRSSSCSGRSFTGPHPKHGMKLYRVTSRSQSREWAQMTDLDSSWSSAESTEDFSSPESKGCFLGSLDPVYDSRSRHLMMKRPILKFEEKHRLLCKWHQLPVCAICGVDSSSTSTSGLGTMTSAGRTHSSSNSTHHRRAKERSPPDGATDNDELPELEMDDIFSTSTTTCSTAEADFEFPHHHESSSSSSFQQQQLDYLKKIRSLVYHNNNSSSITTTKTSGEKPCAGGDGFLDSDDASSTSGACRRDCQGGGGGMKRQTMSKVNSCESFLSLNSDACSSLDSCDLEYNLGDDTECFLDTLETELHNLKQSCFDMDSNIVNLRVASQAVAIPTAALTPEECRALALELGLSDNEDEREEEEEEEEGGIAGSSISRAQSLCSSSSYSRPQSHMSLEWDYPGGLDDDGVASSSSPVSQLMSAAAAPGGHHQKHHNAGHGQDDDDAPPSSLLLLSSLDVYDAAAATTTTTKQQQEQSLLQNISGLSKEIEEGKEEQRLKMRSRSRSCPNVVPI